MIRFNSQPALNISFVGFGQGGSRMVDVFASFKSTDGKPYYKTYGLNSNKNDFMELKNIPQDNLVSLDLNGFGKDPSEAIDIINMHDESLKKIDNLVERIHNKDDDLIVFCATLGGGTGTSTIIKTLEAYIKKYVDPEINQVLESMLEKQNITPEQFMKLPDDKKKLAKVKAVELAYKLNRIKKVGIIAALPVRSDGPNTLSQVNKFTNYLWTLSKNPLKAIAFISFPDNQKFYDDWVKNKDVLKEKNYRDYANVQVAEVFHELNLGTNMGGTDVTFDPKDFRKVMLEGEGCLNINRTNVNSSKVNSSNDMYELLSETFQGSLLHDSIVLQEMDQESKELVHQKVFNVGLLTVTNDELKDISSSYLDEVKESLSTNLYLNGSVFTGHVNVSRTSYKAVAYTFYKTHGLPARLSKGLVEELTEFRQRKGAVKFKTDSIEKANEESIDLDFDDIKETSLKGSLGSGSDLDFLNDLKDEVSNEDEENNNLGKNDLDFLKDLKL
ncbi:cell division protein FtsZ [Virgibacillus halodenitrificans]|uniref:cell division protein FtsZ n=1 Tax=Virgibacillus halodenitrificans TaxID=1482 RepID=UPI003B97CEC1